MKGGYYQVHRGRILGVHIRDWGKYNATHLGIGIEMNDEMMDNEWSHGYMRVKK